jgi:hypothetical protein
MKGIFPEILFGATDAKAAHMKGTIFRFGKRVYANVDWYFLG